MLLNTSRIRMIEPFVNDISLRITASQIAKQTGQNQKSVQLFFHSLEKQALFQSTLQGRNKLFFWNMQNRELVIQFMSAVEHMRTFSFYQTHPFIKQFTQKIQPYVQGIMVIFGSYANNTQTEKSDIDLCIIGSYNKKEVERILAMYQLPISLKHMSKFSLNTLTKEIQQKHIILKNTQQYIYEVMKWIN